MCSFQCDLCVFRLLFGRNPRLTSHADEFSLASIRRINLDALWSSEPKTVNSNRYAVRKSIALSEFRQLPPPFPRLGPHAIKDHMGYGVALLMVWDSLEKGRYAKYKQFDTIRGLRTAYVNVWDASGWANTETLALSSEDRKAVTVWSSAPVHSRWFKRFTMGCKKRMGKIHKPDLALTGDVMKEYLRELEWELLEVEGTEQVGVVELGALSAIEYGCSLRGPEGFMVDLKGLIKYQGRGRGAEHDRQHTIIPLLGRFKNEVGERTHLCAMVDETDSGLKLGVWVDRLIKLRTRQRVFSGPAFRTSQGYAAKIGDFEPRMLDVLKRVQERCPELIPPEVNIDDDYGLNRSFRRGATTTAQANGVSDAVINLVNRWRKVENSKGGKPSLQMIEHYVDIRMMLKRVLQFSSGL